MICCWARVASLFRITVFRQKGMLSSSIKVLKGLCFVVIVICPKLYFGGMMVFILIYWVLILFGGGNNHGGDTCSTSK
jgi:hypothetical protein